MINELGEFSAWLTDLSRELDQLARDMSHVAMLVRDRSQLVAEPLSQPMAQHLSHILDYQGPLEEIEAGYLARMRHEIVHAARCLRLEIAELITQNGFPDDPTQTDEPQGFDCD